MYYCDIYVNTMTPSLLSIIFITGLVIVPDYGANAMLTTGCSNHQNLIDNSVDLDVERYEGVWFEQVRTHNSPFENDCFCSQANYTLANDGSLIVDNSCRKGAAIAPISSATGKAIIPYSKHTGFLLVSFWLPFVKASYVVLDTDYTNYSIIASCPRFYGDGLVWILTRDQTPEPTFIENLKNKTSSFGFSHIKLFDTYQGSKCNNPIDDENYKNFSYYDEYF